MAMPTGAPMATGGALKSSGVGPALDPETWTYRGQNSSVSAPFRPDGSGDGACRGGEFVAAVELRRLFAGVTDNVQARECARTIAGWKPLPVRLPSMLRR